MKQGFFRRACTLATAIAAAAGVLVVAAPTASASDQDVPCNGNLRIRNQWFSLEVGAEPTPRICYGIANTASDTYVVEGAGAVVGTTASFNCGAYISGFVGDPAEPATYVPYRVGRDDTGGVVRFCLEAGASAATVVFAPSAFAVRSDDYGRFSDDGDPCGRDYVHVSALTVQQSVAVALTQRFMGTPPDPANYECESAAVAAGVIECAIPGGCRPSPATMERVAQLVALVESAPGVVEATAWAALTVVLTKVAEVLSHPLVKPLVDEALRLSGLVGEEARKAADAAWAALAGAVSTVLAVVAETEGTVRDLARQFPVRTGNDLGNCSSSVGGIGSVSVRRSSVGTVPASVCVVTGTSVARVTVG